MCLVEGLDYVVRYVSFPHQSADGIIVSHPDGIANIYINKDVCPSRQRKALRHELEHLKSNDLYSDEPVSVIEGRMHD